MSFDFQFLSMKLTAASMFYDFNSETDAFETMQVLLTTLIISKSCTFIQIWTIYRDKVSRVFVHVLQQEKACEALKMQKMAKEGCEGISSAQFGSLDLSFGNYPSWPRNTWRWPKNFPLLFQLNLYQNKPDMVKNCRFQKLNTIVSSLTFFRI